MDSRRFLLAVGLMIALVAITNILFPPVPQPATAPAADSLAAPAATDSPTAPPAAPVAQDTAPADSAAPPAAVAEVAADTVVVESPLYRYAISTAGAAIVSAELLRYESYATEANGPVQLAPGIAPGLLAHQIQIGGNLIDLREVPLTADQEALTVAEGDSARTLTLSGQHPGTGAFIALELTFRPDEYVVDARLRVTGADPDRVVIHLGPTLPFNEPDRAEDERALAFAVRGGDGIATTRLSNLEEQRTIPGPLDWVVLHNKYFMAALVRAQGMPFSGLVAQPVPGLTNAGALYAYLEPDLEEAFTWRFYIGPQDQQRLAQLGYQIQDANPIGYRWLRPILQPIGHAITWALVGMHNVLGLGYGWVLILFGILIRLVLWPLNAKAMRSQMRQMELQPRIKEIQSRYKTQPELLQKEMIRLYKEEGFNPMSGCLPLLIPFPVLIALFFVFQGTIEFRGVEFLWLPDLSRADPFYILPLLLGASMFITQWLSTRSATEVQPQMKFLMYFMPIFMTFIFLNFASGLNLYYASMNLASVPQQLQIMRERKAWNERRQQKS